MKLELGMGNGAKKPVKYPTKRTVNLAKREPHSQSVMTLSIGTAVIIVLVVLVVKFGALDQRQQFLHKKQLLLQPVRIVVSLFPPIHNSARSVGKKRLNIHIGGFSL